MSAEEAVQLGVILRDVAPRLLRGRRVALQSRGQAFDEGPQGPPGTLTSPPSYRDFLKGTANLR